jgi:hypothetical protein
MQETVNHKSTTRLKERNQKEKVGGWAIAVHPKDPWLSMAARSNQQPSPNLLCRTTRGGRRSTRALRLRRRDLGLLWAMLH